MKAGPEIQRLDKYLVYVQGWTGPHFNIVGPRFRQEMRVYNIISQSIENALKTAKGLSIKDGLRDTLARLGAIEPI